MKYELVVIENFLSYVKGEIIKDVKKIEELIESEWQAHFIKRAAPQEPTK